MGGGPAQVPGEGLSPSRVESWAREIRDYLLGRLAVSARIEPLRTVRDAPLGHVPIRRWWTFEGKRYAMLGGPLALNWTTVVRIARLMDATLNPASRVSERAEGVVDWPSTLARGGTRLRPEYVVRSSGVGLGDAERTALRGWAKWITAEWTQYVSFVAPPLPGPTWAGFADEVEGAFDLERLHRWAHTARRSRWPLLRDIVAESLRPLLERDDLDRIPLPSDPARLFEILCLVRIARRLAPPPRELRWLDLELNGNVIRLDGLTCHYQQTLERERVLATPEYAGALARAVELFSLRVPRFVDLAFDFESPGAGFDGIVVEVKSGQQQFETAVAQLRTYLAARPRRPGSRYLAWGIIERPERSGQTAVIVTRALLESRGCGDVWIFSSVEEIDVVLDVVFGRKTAELASAMIAPAQQNLDR